MPRCLWLLLISPLLWPPGLWAQSVDKRELDATLARMRDHLGALLAYEAEITRTTVVSAEAEGQGARHDGPVATHSPACVI